MFNFEEYSLIKEEILTDHISHPEEQVFTHGMQGAIRAANQLKSLVDGKATITEKYDGAPSLLFGRHPDTGKFFVSTKSFFNRDPKINYDHGDIDFNHPKTPNLREVLKHAHDLLSQNDYDHVYRGDVMYHHGNYSNNNGVISFSPNVIEYSIPTKTDLGKKIKNSQLGIAVHTGYEGNINNLRSFPINNIDKEIPGVTFISSHHPGFRDRNEAGSTLTKLKEIINSPKSKFDLPNRDVHAPLLNMYINDTIRNNNGTTSHGYQKFLTDRATKESGKYKTPAKKDSIHTHYDLLHRQVETNRDHFDKAFDIHNHIMRTKNSLVDMLNRNSDFSHSVGGVPSDPEGYVAYTPTGITKLVKRHNFSRLNFKKNDNGR